MFVPTTPSPANNVRAGVFACVATLLLAGCQGVDPETLPAVPDLDLKAYAAPIERQLTAALEAVRARPTKAAVNGDLGMMLQTYKQYEAAEIMYRRARALDPQSLRWAYLHAVTLESLGQPGPAVDALRSALEIQAYAPASVRLAELLAKLGDNDAAAAAYHTLLDAEDTPSEGYFSYGRFLLAQGRAAEAIAPLTEALAMSGDFGAVHYQLALAYRGLKKSEQAQRHFTLAETFKAHRATGSDPLLNALVSINQSAMEFVQRARSLAERGQLDEAERYINLALERDPDSFAAHASIMGLYTTRRDFQKVDAHFERARMLEPENPKLYYNLGIARAAEGRLIEAGEAFERSRALDPNAPNTHIQLALLSQRAGKPMPARAALARALELDPAHQDAHWLLGGILAAAGESQAALSHLTKAAEKRSRLQPQMLALLAQTHAVLGDGAAADAALQRAQQALSGNADPAQRKAVAAATRRLAEIREAGPREQD